MDIYFAASIRGGRGDAEVYQKLFAHLKKYGRVLTEHVGDPNLTNSGEYHLPPEEVFERDLKWMAEADALVAEVSTPSLGVGYEIARAEERGLPILCLYKIGSEKKLSNMIRGNKKLVVKEYEEFGEALAAIDKFFADSTVDRLSKIAGGKRFPGAMKEFYEDRKSG